MCVAARDPRTGRVPHRGLCERTTAARAVDPSMWGVTVRDRPGSAISVRLENEDRHAEWVTDGSVPLLIVVATLDYLIEHPEEAKPWRSI
jgi:hypothetical protein